MKVLGQKKGIKGKLFVLKSFKIISLKTLKLAQEVAFSEDDVTRNIQI